MFHLKGFFLKQVSKLQGNDGRTASLICSEISNILWLGLAENTHITFYRNIVCCLISVCILYQQHYPHLTCQSKEETTGQEVFATGGLHVVIYNVACE